MNVFFSVFSASGKMLLTGALESAKSAQGVTSAIGTDWNLLPQYTKLYYITCIRVLFRFLCNYLASASSSGIENLYISDLLGKDFLVENLR